MQGEKEWAVPIKEKGSLDSSSSAMDFKALMGQVEVLPSSKSAAAALRNLLRCCYLRLNSSCIFGGQKPPH